MSEFTPMSRAMMQELKSQKDEEARQAQIKMIVGGIYVRAIQVAEKTVNSSYNFRIPTAPYVHNPPMNMSCNPHNQSGPSDPFHVKNMKDILAGLQVLFPECKVTHTLMARKNDGTLYDISKFDDSVLPLVNELLQESYIVIDWS